ncbi:MULTISPECIES: hypothetical protein [Legionella]|uniref:hypothetical protein n=1 Tax=Legionella TaxID=445 RepID=UPI000960A340|nr:hypothetical protein [Legionella sp. 39-23]OJW06384.1 MAG: hypothetical protein BGO44_09900 [Legionella sp. 39-23]
MSITMSSDSLRALRHPEMNEVDSTVIKSNILIEQQLNEIVKDYFFHPKYFKDDNISLATICKFAQAASLSYSDDKIWTIIKKLSSFRNKIAHNLQHPKRDTEIRNLKHLYNALFLHKLDKHFLWKDNDSDAMGLHIVTLTCLSFLIEVHNEVKRLKISRINSRDKK